MPLHFFNSYVSQVTIVINLKLLDIWANKSCRCCLNQTFSSCICPYCKTSLKCVSVLLFCLFPWLRARVNLQNANFVDINVKEATTNGNNLGYYVLLGKMNGFENLLAAQDEKILAMLKTI